MGLLPSRESESASEFTATCPRHTCKDMLFFQNMEGKMSDKDKNKEPQPRHDRVEKKDDRQHREQAHDHKEGSHGPHREIHKSTDWGTPPPPPPTRKK